MQLRKPLLCFLLLMIILFSDIFPVNAVNSSAAVSYPQTLGKSVLLMDASSGRVLYEKNAHNKMPPASVTKIMTALLVVENADLDRKITISKNAADTPESSVWLEAGEKLTVKQLLYACMLHSANDAAVALSESVAGSENRFVNLMNQRARQLGMKDTHFCNPHGLETKGHYTTAYDLALVSREALNYKVFRQVVSTKTETIPWPGKDYDRLLINQNRLLYRYDGAVGIKTGYTKQAGNCVVGAAQKGSMLLIAVSMNSPSVYQDLEQMLDYGFANYHKEVIKKSKDFKASVPVINGQAETVKVRSKTDLTLAVTNDEKNHVSYKINTLKQITAPVKKGQILGSCDLYINENKVSKVELLASDSIPRKSPFLKRLISGCITVIMFVLKAFLIIFCILYLIRIINLRRNRRKKQTRSKR